MKLFILALITLLSLNVSAFTSSRTFKKTLSKTGIREFVVSNKYGNIVVDQTLNGTIEVEAILSVGAKSKEKSDELLEYIAIEMTKVGDMGKVTTSFGKNMDFRQLLSSTIVQIDYKIKIPQGIALRIINTKGNVTIPNYNGNVNINVLHGNVILGNFDNGELYIVQEEGSCGIAHVEHLTATFDAANLNLKSGGDVKLTTSATDVTIADVETLTVNSTGGVFKITDIESIFGTSSYTDYTIQDITDNLNMSIRWGSLNVGGIHRDFEKIMINSSSAKLGLNFMQDAGYSLSLIHNKTLKMDFPPYIQLTTTPTTRKNRFTGSTFVGNKKFNGKVELDINGGTLYIQ